MSGDIKALPKPLRETLRTGVRINSLKHCVVQLVYNSLDANSTSVAVRVDPVRRSIQVVDNGHGITERNFKSVGVRYMTSKYQSPGGFGGGYGYQGETLASLRYLSETLSITSKAANATYTKLYRKSKLESFAAAPNRPSPGTTVIITGFMYNFPVRQKRTDKTEMDKLKGELEVVSLMHPSCSFSLRNDNTKDVVFQTAKTKYVRDRLADIYDADYARTFKRLQYEGNRMKIVGLVSVSGYPHRRTQYIYVNKRHVTMSCLYATVNGFLRKRLLHKVRNSTVVSPNKIKYAAYVLNIKCGAADVDVVDRIDYVVQFKDDDGVTRAIEGALTSFLRKHNFVEADRREGEAAVAVVDKNVVVGAIRGRPAKRIKSDGITLINKRVKTDDLISDEVTGKKLVLDIFLKSTAVYKLAPNKFGLSQSTVTQASVAITRMQPKKIGSSTENIINSLRSTDKPEGQPSKLSKLRPTKIHVRRESLRKELTELKLRKKLTKRAPSKIVDNRWARRGKKYLFSATESTYSHRNIVLMKNKRNKSPDRRRIGVRNVRRVTHRVYYDSTNPIKMRHISSMLGRLHPKLHCAPPNQPIAPQKIELKAFKPPKKSHRSLHPKIKRHRNAFKTPKTDVDRQKLLDSVYRSVMKTSGDQMSERYPLFGGPDKSDNLNKLVDLMKSDNLNTSDDSIGPVDLNESDDLNRPVDLYKPVDLTKLDDLNNPVGLIRPNDYGNPSLGQIDFIPYRSNPNLDKLGGQNFLSFEVSDKNGGGNRFGNPKLGLYGNEGFGGPKRCFPSGDVPENNFGNSVYWLGDPKFKLGGKKSFEVSDKNGEGNCFGNPKLGLYGNGGFGGPKRCFPSGDVPENNFGNSVYCLGDPKWDGSKDFEGPKNCGQFALRNPKLDYLYKNKTKNCRNFDISENSTNLEAENIFQNQKQYFENPEENCRTLFSPWKISGEKIEISRNYLSNPKLDYVYKNKIKNSREFDISENSSTFKAENIFGNQKQYLENPPKTLCELFRSSEISKTEFENSKYLNLYKNKIKKCKNRKNKIKFCRFDDKFDISETSPNFEAENIFGNQKQYFENPQKTLCQTEFENSKNINYLTNAKLDYLYKNKTQNCRNPKNKIKICGNPKKMFGDKFYISENSSNFEAENIFENQKLGRNVDEGPKNYRQFPLGEVSEKKFEISTNENYLENPKLDYLYKNNIKNCRISKKMLVDEFDISENSPLYKNKTKNLRNTKKFLIDKSDISENSPNFEAQNIFGNQKEYFENPQKKCPLISNENYLKDSKLNYLYKNISENLEGPQNYFRGPKLDYLNKNMEGSKINCGLFPSCEGSEKNFEISTFGNYSKNPKLDYLYKDGSKHFEGPQKRLPPYEISDKNFENSKIGKENYFRDPKVDYLYKNGGKNLEGPKINCKIFPRDEVSEKNLENSTTGNYQKNKNFGNPKKCVDYNFDKSEKSAIFDGETIVFENQKQNFDSPKKCESRRDNCNFLKLSKNFLENKIIVNSNKLDGNPNLVAISCKSRHFVPVFENQNLDLRSNCMEFEVESDYRNPNLDKMANKINLVKSENQKEHFDLGLISNNKMIDNSEFDEETNLDLPSDKNCLNKSEDTNEIFGLKFISKNKTIDYFETATMEFDVDKNYPNPNLDLISSKKCLNKSEGRNEHFDLGPISKNKNTVNSGGENSKNLNSISSKISPASSLTISENQKPYFDSNCCDISKNKINRNSNVIKKTKMTKIAGRSSSKKFKTLFENQKLSMGCFEDQKENSGIIPESNCSKFLENKNAANTSLISRKNTNKSIEINPKLDNSDPKNSMTIFEKPKFGGKAVFESDNNYRNQKSTTVSETQKPNIDINLHSNISENKSFENFNHSFENFDEENPKSANNPKIVLVNSECQTENLPTSCFDIFQNKNVAKSINFDSLDIFRNSKIAENSSKKAVSENQKPQNQNFNINNCGISENNLRINSVKFDGEHNFWNPILDDISCKNSPKKYVWDFENQNEKFERPRKYMSIFEDQKQNFDGDNSFLKPKLDDILCKNNPKKCAREFKGPYGNLECPKKYVLDQKVSLDSQNYLMATSEKQIENLDSQKNSTVISDYQIENIDSQTHSDYQIENFDSQKKCLAIFEGEYNNKNPKVDIFYENNPVKKESENEYRNPKLDPFKNNPKMSVKQNFDINWQINCFENSENTKNSPIYSAKVDDKTKNTNSNLENNNYFYNQNNSLVISDSFENSEINLEISNFDDRNPKFDTVSDKIICESQKDIFENGNVAKNHSKKSTTENILIDESVFGKTVIKFSENVTKIFHKYLPSPPLMDVDNQNNVKPNLDPPKNTENENKSNLISKFCGNVYAKLIDLTTRSTKQFFTQNINQNQNNIYVTQNYCQQKNLENEYKSILTPNFGDNLLENSIDFTGKSTKIKQHLYVPRNQNTFIVTQNFNDKYFLSPQKNSENENTSDKTSIFGENASAKHTEINENLNFPQNIKENQNKLNLNQNFSDQYFSSPLKKLENQNKSIITSNFDGKSSAKPIDFTTKSTDFNITDLPKSSPKEKYYLSEESKYTQNDRPELSSDKQDGHPTCAELSIDKQDGRPTGAELSSDKQDGRPTCAELSSDKQDGRPTCAELSSDKQDGRLSQSNQNGGPSAELSNSKQNGCPEPLNPKRNVGPEPLNPKQNGRRDCAELSSDKPSAELSNSEQNNRWESLNSKENGRSESLNPKQNGRPDPSNSTQNVCEWQKMFDGSGKPFYVNKRSGFVNFESPKLNDTFCMTKRHDFVPKGMSPLLASPVKVCDDLTPSSKYCLHETMTKNIEDELRSVKWMNFFQDKDAKQFFKNLYSDNESNVLSSIKTTNKCNEVITRDMLHNATVVCQFDNKFIVATLDIKLLILFDQHAVDERIRLENLLRYYYDAETRTWNTIRCKLEVCLENSDIRFVQSYRKSMENWGMHVNVTNNTSAAELKQFFARLIAECREQGTSSTQPPNCLMDIIKTEACRSAIKFGESLTGGKCQNLIDELAGCDLPFQCAHGRPTLIPILDLKDIGV